MQFLANVRFKSQSADPGSPVEGDCWYRGDLKELRLRDSVNTVRLGPDYPDTSNATDAGLLAQTYDPLGLPNQTAIPTAGVVYLARMPWRKAALISNVCYAVNTAGATLTSGQNFVGVYDSAGTRQAVSADQSTAWLSTGWTVTAVVTPVTVAGSPTGWIWVAFLSNGTTRPAIGKASGTASLFAANRGVAAASSFHGHILTGQTTLPSSITPSSIVQDANNLYAAVS